MVQAPNAHHTAIFGDCLLERHESVQCAEELSQAADDAVFYMLDHDIPARIPVVHHWRAAGKLAQISFSISSTREGGDLTYEVGTVIEFSKM